MNYCLIVQKIVINRFSFIFRIFNFSVKNYK